MILIQGRNEYITEDQRKEQANFLCAILEANFNEKFRPFMPNKGDTENWSICSSNNWWVKFFHDRPTTFGISYRYDRSIKPEDNKHEKAMADFLVVRYPSYKIVT